MWERYCRGVQAIVFVVDSSDVDSLDQVSYMSHVDMLSYHVE